MVATTVIAVYVRRPEWPTEHCFRRAVSVFFDQNSKDDMDTLRALCSCFGLYQHPKFQPGNLYRGMLRLTWKRHDLFLVGRFSPYYKLKPSNVRPLSLDRPAASG